MVIEVECTPRTAARVPEIQYTEDAIAPALPDLPDVPVPEIICKYIDFDDFDPMFLHGPFRVPRRIGPTPPARSAALRPRIPVRCRNALPARVRRPDG